MAACDWRTKLPKDVREEYVKKIVDGVMRRELLLRPRYEVDILEVKIFGLNFEEKVYLLASDEEEYKKRIEAKLKRLEEEGSPLEYKKRIETKLKRPAEEGSHPNVVPTSSASKPSYFCQKDSNPVGNQGQSIATKSKDQSQVCEVPEHHTLPDFRSVVQMQGETQQTALALLSNQVQKSQAGSLGRELNSESQPEKMQLSGIPDSSLEQMISKTDNLQEEVYQK